MIELKITDEGDALQKAMAKVPKKMVKSGALESLVIATQPTVNAMREGTPVDEGDLRLSIGFRLRRYKNGKVLFVAIGPRKGVFGKSKKRPALTAHLIERGHWTRTGKKGKGKKVWVPANAFMRRAWLLTRDACLRRFRQEFGSRLMIEVRNRSAKRRKSK